MYTKLVQKPYLQFSRSPKFRKLLEILTEMKMELFPNLPLSN